jgi:hypothetical protein
MFTLRNHLLVGMTAFFLGCLLVPAQSHASQLVIRTTSLPSGTAGVWYSTGIAIQGGTAPYTLTATGLPSGLSITNKWLAIIGLPATGGTYSIGFTVTDSSSTMQTAKATLSLFLSGTTTSSLSISTASLPGATAGTAYSTTVAASGGTKPYVYSVSGLPGGLSMNTSTGAISGTPTASGTASVSITVKDSTTPTAKTATKSMSLVVSAASTSPLSISTASLPGATAGTAYSTSVVASGGTKPYIYSASGLPSGFAISGSTGAITGTTSTSGTDSVAITVKDSTTPTAKTATKTMSLVVSAASTSPLTITTTSLPAATAGTAYSMSLVASGGTKPYTYSASGLPSGLSISSSTGAITGTPTTSGTDSVAITVKDSTTPTAKTASATLSLSVGAAIQAASCGNMSTGNLASLNGFVPFPSSNLWNTNVASSAVDANSATIISGLGSSALHPDFSNVADGDYGIPYVVVDTSVTPGVKVAMDGYADQSDNTQYPFTSSTPIEGQPANCSTSAGDQHVLVLDKNKCFLYETWSTELCNGSWSASNGAIWDLSNTSHRPYGWTSADAAGLPVFPGLVRYDEVAAGAIHHALRMTVNNTLSGSGGGYFVNPASHAAGNSSSTHNVIGMRLRLKSSFNISGFSASNQVILKAMQQYGLIVADNGSNMYFQGTPDARWNDDDLDKLKTIGASNFEVVQMSPSYPGYEESTAPAGSAPSISSFTASQTTVAPGTTVTLNWTVSNDSYDFIDVFGPVRNGSQTVTPTKTTTYTLNSTNAYGRSTKAVTVTVN